MSVANLSVGGASVEPRVLVHARLAVAIVAVVIVAAGLAALSWMIMAAAGLPSPPARNPFGTGAIGPSPSGISAIILTVQAHFYAALTSAVVAIKTEGAQITALATVGFLYGIFHAAGPGHGKGVIAGYIVATGGSIARGLGLSLTAALLQACVAITLVGVFALLLNATSASISAAANIVELASFAAVAALGTVLVWIKAGEFVHVAAAGLSNGKVGHDANDNPGVMRAATQSWRGLIAVVVAAGIRPCSGAIILLVFSLSQGLLIAGVLGALAMALGTAITTGTLAALTVFCQSLIKRLTGGGSTRGAIAFSGIEVLAAAFVMALGFALLAGQWVGGVPQFLD